MGSRPIALTLLAAAIMQSPAYSQSAINEPISGVWYSYTWGGLLPDDTHRCLLATVTERHYDLSKDKLGHMGQFATITWTYPFVANGPCVIGGTTLKPVELTARFWALSGFGEHSIVRLGGKFENCIGIYCSNPKTNKADFTADIHTSSDALDETDEDNPTWHQHYVPLAKYQSQFVEVRAAAEKLREAFASGKAEQLRPLLSEVMNPDFRDTLLQQLPARKKQFALTEELEPIANSTFVMSPGADIVDPRVTAVAFFVFAARSEDDVKQAGRFIFSKEGNEWKLVALS